MAIELTLVLIEKLHQDLKLLDHFLREERRFRTFDVIVRGADRGFLLREQPVFLALGLIGWVCLIPGNQVGR